MSTAQTLDNVQKFLINSLIEREQTVSTSEVDREFEGSVAKLLAATFRLSKLREIFYVEQKSFELEVEMGVYESELLTLFLIWKDSIWKDSKLLYFGVNLRMISFMLSF